MVHAAAPRSRAAPGRDGNVTPRTKSEALVKILKRKLAPGRPTAVDASAAAHAALVHLLDEMIDVYVSWREESAAVDASYENWNRATAADKTLAFSAYVAALDREARAAADYQRVIEQITSLDDAAALDPDPRRRR
jgi:hypothetical protein